jgi:hypothetical protein
MPKLPTLTLQDFAAYESHRQRDPEYNAFRLAVRRKLGLYGKHLEKLLKEHAELDLKSRTSLERPYKFNLGRVGAQWAYLSRSPKEKKALQARVGPALGKDVDTHYIQTTLVLSIDSEGLEQAMRIHSLAWWDGQNLKLKCSEPESLDEWVDLLNGLPQGFILFMDNWRKEYVCGRLHVQDLRAYFKTYTPGEHWLNLRRRIPKGLACELGEELQAFVDEGTLALAPLYRFLLWTPENDQLFDEDGRVRRLD